MGRFGGASFLHVMQRNCQSVTLANIAQTLNVVGLIMVNTKGVWTEPVYWPLWLLRHQRGTVASDTYTERAISTLQLKV